MGHWDQPWEGQKNHKFGHFLEPRILTGLHFMWKSRQMTSVPNRLESISRVFFALVWKFFFQDFSLLPVKNEELAFWVVWGSVLSCAGSFRQPKAGLGCFGLKTKRVNAGIKWMSERCGPAFSVVFRCPNSVVLDSTPKQQGMSTLVELEFYPLNLIITEFLALKCESYFLPIWLQFVFKRGCFFYKCHRKS